MLKELLEIKKEMEPVIHEANVKLNVLAREVIVRKKEYEIYGPMVDRVYLDNAIYVKVMSSGRDVKTDNVTIKNGFYMVFVAPEKESTKENQKLTRENSKSAGSFRDTKTYINLVVEKNTESQICEKLLDDVEKYFIGGG
ncbi:hypothetical protein E5I49_04485 [Campylobacter jejuni]|nr:hypothetical protein [Campylobacter jejuni]